MGVLGVRLLEDLGGLVRPCPPLMQGRTQQQLLNPVVREYGVERFKTKLTVSYSFTPSLLFFNSSV